MEVLTIDFNSQDQLLTDINVLLTTLNQQADVARSVLPPLAEAFINIALTIENSIMVPYSGRLHEKQFENIQKVLNGKGDVSEMMRKLGNHPGYPKAKDYMGNYALSNPVEYKRENIDNKIHHSVSGNLGGDYKPKVIESIVIDYPEDCIEESCKFKHFFNKIKELENGVYDFGNEFGNSIFVNQKLTNGNSNVALIPFRTDGLIILSENIYEDLLVLHKNSLVMGDLEMLINETILKEFIVDWEYPDVSLEEFRNELKNLSDELSRSGLSGKIISEGLIDFDIDGLECVINPYLNGESDIFWYRGVGLRIKGQKNDYRWEKFTPKYKAMFLEFTQELVDKIKPLSDSEDYMGGVDPYTKEGQLLIHERYQEFNDIVSEVVKKLS